MRHPLSGVSASARRGLPLRRRTRPSLPTRLVLPPRLPLPDHRARFPPPRLSSRTWYVLMHRLPLQPLLDLKLTRRTALRCYGRNDQGTSLVRLSHAKHVLRRRERVHLQNGDEPQGFVFPCILHANRAGPPQPVASIPLPAFDLFTRVATVITTWQRSGLVLLLLRSNSVNDERPSSDHAHMREYRLHGNILASV